MDSLTETPTIGKMKKGTKVKFVNTSEMVAAFGDNDDPNVYLTLGNIYTVAKIDIRKWYSKILLDEISSRWFNSKHFEFIYKRKSNGSKIN